MGNSDWEYKVSFKGDVYEKKTKKDDDNSFWIIIIIGVILFGLYVIYHILLFIFSIFEALFYVLGNVLYVLAWPWWYPLYKAYFLLENIFFESIMSGLIISIPAAYFSGYLSGSFSLVGKNWPTFLKWLLILLLMPWIFYGIVTLINIIFGIV
jgi:hypothetical protein